MNIYVLRHGQTELNLQGKFQGRIDIELNETGKNQVKKTKEELEKIKFDKIFVSPLKRAIETARIVTKQEITIDDRIIERNFGKLEGKASIPDYEENVKKYEIEPLEEINKRAEEFIKEIKEKYKKSENILIVTHEAVAQSINAYFSSIKNTKEFRLKTGSYVIYKISESENIMKELEEKEINIKILEKDPQKVEKNKKEKENLRIVYLMAWTKVCGGSKIILEYANKLAQRGHKITIISYDQKPEWFNLNEKIEFKQIPYNRKIEENIPECDIIVPTSWKNISTAIQAKKAPVTFFEQGGSHIFETENISKIKFEAVKNRINLLTFIHTVSSYSKNKIKEIYQKEAEVICNAIDSNIFYSLKSKKETNINITIIGSEKFRFKNIDETIEAIRKIKNKYNNIKLNWITQDKPQKNNEKAIINPEQKEIGDILRKTDIFICNSEYESFCLPVLEAMACGVAVITTDNGGIRDFVKDKHNALIIKKHNQEDMIEKIEYLINNEKEKLEIIENAKKTATKFNWENSVKQMENYYRKIATYSIKE